VDPAIVTSQILDHERQAAALRRVATAWQVEYGHPEAERHEREAVKLREQLAQHLRDRRAARVAVRDADQVTVEWLRDGPPEGFRIDEVQYPSGKGPLRRRPTAGAVPTSRAEPVVEVTPGEVGRMPRDHARVLAEAGYVRVLD
jgi:hypothetical protein